MTDSKLKKLQMVETNILKQIVNLCEKHDINYFAAYGTLLGAVRHQGFIPWDDDIDIMMPRPDYDKFCEIAKTELEYPYFLQTIETDPGYMFAIAKVHNLKTTFIQKHQVKSNLKGGIYADIWPLDGWEDVKQCQKNYDFYRRLYKYYDYCSCIDICDKFKYICYAIIRMIFYSGKDRKYFYNRMSSVPYNKARIISIREASTPVVYQMKWLEKQVTMKFEDININVPADYDAILKAEYGDYMTLPPENERVSHHERLIVDTEKAYTEYIN